MSSSFALFLFLRSLTGCCISAVRPAQSLTLSVVYQVRNDKKLANCCVATKKWGMPVVGRCCCTSLAFCGYLADLVEIVRCVVAGDEAIDDSANRRPHYCGITLVRSDGVVLPDDDVVGIG